MQEEQKKFVWKHAQKGGNNTVINLHIQSVDSDSCHLE